MIEMVDLWGKLPLNATKGFTTRRLKDVECLVVHCTDVEGWTPQRLNEYDIGPNHISKTGCPTCTYHDYIRIGGEWYHMVDYDVRTWHVGKWNKTSIGVALEFKPDKDHNPDPDMMNTLIEYLATACLFLGLAPRTIVGHRELEGTGYILDESGHLRLLKTCPGLEIDLDKLRELVMAYIGEHEERILAGSGESFVRVT